MIRSGEICTDASPGAPEHIAHYIIGGDFNVSRAAGVQALRPFVSKTDRCVSTSQFVPSLDAQKSDWAVSHGIELVSISSYVGKHNEPCISDAHDMVVVAGLITAPESHGGASQPAANATVLASGSAQTSSSSATSQLVVQQFVAMDSVRVGVQVRTKPSQLPSAVPHSGAAQPAATPKTAIIDADQTGAAQAAVDVSVLARGPAQTSSSSATSPSVVSQPPNMGSVQGVAQAQTKPSQPVALVPHSGAAQPGVASTTAISAADQTGAAQAAADVTVPARGPAQTSSSNATSPSVFSQAHGPPHSGAGQLASTSRTLSIAAEQTSSSSAACGSASPVPHSGIQPMTSEAPQLAAGGSQSHEQMTARWPSFGEVLSDLGTRALGDDARADDVLTTLLFTDHGMRVRSDQELAQGLGRVIERRQQFIHKVAHERGDSQHARGVYTTEEWIRWLSTQPLNERDMERGLGEWKGDFMENEMAKSAEVLALEEEGSRDSKKKARNMVRGAWVSSLAHSCGHSQLAIAFFRFPAAELDSLLREWQTYMQSPGYRAHVQRTDRARDAHVADEQRAAKFECHRLRNQLRRARKDDCDINEGKLDVNSMSWRRWEVLQEFRSGELARKTDEATRKHGFGLIRTGTPTSLNAPSFVRDR